MSNEIEGAMPPLPEPYQREIYATTENTPAVRDGYEMGGYVKVPALYTADQLQAYAAPLVARVAELQAARDRMKSGLEWVRGYISRYDPPGLPNHIVQHIDAAIAAKE